MGFKNKSVLSVHNYSQSKKWELFVKYMRHNLNLFAIHFQYLRHPESQRTMQLQVSARRRVKIQQQQWQLVRTQLLLSSLMGPLMRLFLPVAPIRVIFNLHYPCLYWPMMADERETRHRRGEPPLELRPARPYVTSKPSPPRWRVARLRNKTRIAY